MDKKYLEKVGDSANTASFYIQNLPPTVDHEHFFRHLLEQWVDFIDVYDANTIKNLSENKEHAKACEEFHEVLRRFRKLHLLSLLPTVRMEALLKEVEESPLFINMRLKRPSVPSNDIFMIH